MSATIYAQLSYPLSDFTTSGGVVNAVVLKQELGDAELSVTVQSVSASDTVANLFFTGDPSDADVAAIDAVVAAHAGTGFSPTLQKEVLLAEDSDDSGDEKVRLTLDTGVQPAGTYLISWRMELAVTEATGSHACRGHLNVRKNGTGGFTEQAQNNWGEAVWSGFTGALALELVDGDRYEFQLSYERIGAVGNAARVQRARMTWVRLEAS